MSAVKKRNAKHAGAMLQADKLCLATPCGRVLIEELHLSVSLEEVAIVGRNGAGKSTLLEVLAGARSPASGLVRRHGSCVMVPQAIAGKTETLFQGLEAEVRKLGTESHALYRDMSALGLDRFASLNCPHALSRGEWRKLSLLAAKYSFADILLLDEPSEDLDAVGKEWLLQWLSEYQGALLLVSHDDELLAHFGHFFVIAESGCRYFRGSLNELQSSMDERSRADDSQYLRTLTMLGRKEEHHALVARRGRRKKMGGRVREIDRAPSRAQLNGKRSYAQESQGKREKLQAARISASRAWAKAARRALSVQLPLSALLPELAPDLGQENLRLEEVGLRQGGRLLFEKLDLVLRRERVGIVGPNGSGKSSLLRAMNGSAAITSGRVTRRAAVIASISQAAEEWKFEESLLMRLQTQASGLSMQAVAKRLVAHKFPLALAERPMSSLSPGERLRAALLCIFEREPGVQLLLLDEPTDCLDRVGTKALRELLCEFRGGLVIASHDRNFLKAIGISRCITMEEGSETSITELPLS